MTVEPCRFLDWDSRFFDRRIATVSDQRPVDFDAVDGWCRAQRIECLYLLVDAADGQTARAATARGFELTDVRLDFERQPDGAALPPGDESVRPATPTDLPALRAIAGSAHHATRFYFDPRFPRERCDELYRTWISRSVLEGFADRVLVATRSGEPVGYVTLHRDGDAARIGLVGVAEAYRGRAIGRDLLDAALASSGAGTRVRVATQARNIQGARLYERAGFRLASAGIWYHRWALSAGTP